MNLESTHRGLATDGKSFVFVVQGVPLHLPTDELQALLSKRFETDLKVYRAFNKTHVFFTVFAKPSEERLHQIITGEATGVHKFEANFESLKENHEFKLISYARFEEEVRAKIQEADRIRDELPEYMHLLNL